MRAHNRKYDWESIDPEIARMAALGHGGAAIAKAVGIPPKRVYARAELIGVKIGVAGPEQRCKTGRHLVAEVGHVWAHGMRRCRGCFDEKMGRAACLRGHDLSERGRYSNGRCRQCEAEDGAERRRRQRLSGKSQGTPTVLSCVTEAENTERILARALAMETAMAWEKPASRRMWGEERAR